LELRIKGTTDTPDILISTELNTLSISGNCYPENAFQFFQPLIEWMNENHSLFSAPVIAEIKLNYFNSSSGRFLLKFLNTSGSLLSEKVGFSVEWKYESGDDLIKERGEELASVSDVQFRLSEI